MAAVVGVFAMLYLYQLLCLATPVISPVNLSNKRLPINEHLHNNYSIKSCVSTLKSASFAVYEIAAKTTIMPVNSKRITSKRSTSTLAYFLCMSLLLTGGNIERNPGPVQQGHNLKLCAEKGLRICHLNIRSLVNKIDEIRVFCETHKPHVLCLNETWLDTSIADGEIQLDGYSHIRRDKTRHQGGVLVYIASNLNFKERDEIGDESGELQCLWLEIVPPKSKGFLICSSYRPPNSDNERTYVEGLRNMLDNVSDLQKEVILIGDFNFDLKRSRKSAACKCFVDMSKEFGLKQIICDYTRVTQHSKSLIDLFLTSRPDLYITGVMPVGFSDHSVIYAVRKLHRLKPPSSRIINTRNYKCYNQIAFVEDLNKVPWSQIDITGDIEDSWDAFKNLFNDVADSHAPQIHVRTRGQKVPWLTTEIRKLMKERDNLHKLALKTNSELHWSSFKRMRNAGTWKNLKRLLGSNCSEGIKVQQCKIPGEWKKAKVTPLYKNGAKSDPKNFRPISVLPISVRISKETLNRNGAKAFDTIDHDVLIHKLKHYGVSNESLLWFKDYFCARKQFVTIDSHRSEELDIACGVPQGSILGPLLFIIYINDLSSCMRSCSRHGVVFDSHMTWKDQADHVYKKVAVRVNVLRRIRTFLTEKAAIHVYNGIILPVFDYCDITWSSLLQQDEDRLQRLQHRAARIITLSERSSEAMEKLKWSSLNLIGVQVYNMLPDHVMKAESIHTFARLLISRHRAPMDTSLRILFKKPLFSIMSFNLMSLMRARQNSTIRKFIHVYSAHTQPCVTSHKPLGATRLGLYMAKCLASRMITNQLFISFRGKILMPDNFI
ncbi:Hypothetical predicted protein, partial [Paramuricea clavata]